MYPFVWIDDCLVDLCSMRETLTAIHGDAEVAQATLVALRSEPDRGSTIEPLLHVPTVAAHAIVACTRAAGSQLEWWTLLSILHPLLLGALPILQRLRSARVHKEDTDTFLQTAFAPGRFDPRAFPPFQPKTNTTQVLQLLNLHGSWPTVLHGGAERASAVLGAAEASSWSLVFDRRERASGKGPAVDVRASTFVAEVVAQVSNSDPDKDILRTERDLALLRLDSVPLDGPLRHRLTATSKATLQDSPRVRALRTENHIIETVNLSTGAVTWSCLRWQDQGPLMGVRWTTLYRQAWGRGVFVDQRHVDPSKELAAEAERKAILDAEGSFLERWSELMPIWLKQSLFAATSLFLGWFMLCGALAQEPLAFDSVLLNVIRAAFVLLLGTTAWLRYRSTRNPFPAMLWQTKELSVQGAKARRIAEIRRTIAKLWRTFDYSARLPVSAKLGARSTPDRLDNEARAFAIHCQDRLIQEAVVDVAETHGIDMSKFKEGIQQINNYGVIASKIDGPVATGDGASAHQNKSLPEKVGAAVGRTILKKSGAQAGAA
jgi:hypothetical protein